MNVYIVFSKIDGEFDEIKGVHFGSEPALAECVKWITRNNPSNSKIILTPDVGAETEDGHAVALIVKRTVE